MLSKPLRTMEQSVEQEKYYNDFSKYVLKEAENKKSKMNEENYKNITWIEFFHSTRENSKKLDLLKLKLQNLKFIAKTNKLHVSGNKQELVEKNCRIF